MINFMQQARLHNATRIRCRPKLLQLLRNDTELSANHSRWRKWRM